MSDLEQEKGNTALEQARKDGDELIDPTASAV
jgi:hypothetical protein